MHVCCRVSKDVATMIARQETEQVSSHKEENKARIRSDGNDRQNIRRNLEVSIHRLNPTNNPAEIVNIVSDRMAPKSANVDKAVDIGKAQMVQFEEKWPLSFISVAVAEKFVRV